MRKVKPITLSAGNRSTLESWSPGRSMEAWLVLRAKILLLAAGGKLNKEIAAELKTAKTTVIRWRKRFLKEGLAGIERDAPRSGRKPSLPSETVELILHKTTQEKPVNATHWSTRSMAKAVGVSKVTVNRIWRANDLKPHLARTFKVSNDPKFVEKVRDVVGPYLNPPENALVLSYDEKSQIQALDRTQKSLPMMPGRLGTLTHDYQRNGTTTLFASIDTVQGKVIGSCMPKHRHQEWIKFLKQIDVQTDPTLDLHLIVGNYATHKHPKVKACLKRRPRFHVHFIPTSSSWLNVIERWFREITEKRLRRGVFRNVPQLIEAIESFIVGHNESSERYAWTAKADAIIEKVARARASLNK